MSDIRRNLAALRDATMQNDQRTQQFNDMMYKRRALQQDANFKQQQLDLGWAELYAKLNKGTDQTVADMESELAHTSARRAQLQEMLDSGQKTPELESQFKDLDSQVGKLSQGLGSLYNLKMKFHKQAQRMPNPEREAMIKYQKLSEWSANNPGLPPPRSMAMTPADSKFVFGFFNQRLGYQANAERQMKRDIISGNKGVKQAAQDASAPTQQSMGMMNNLSDELNKFTLGGFDKNAAMNSLPAQGGQPPMFSPSTADHSSLDAETDAIANSLLDENP